MKNHIIFFSGGKSSFSVADYVKQKFPNDSIVLYFTDTMWEDEDLYRFIYEASDKLELPMLTHSMGLNPVQLMYEQKVLFNSRIGNCSKYLKMKVAADFIKKGKVPKVESWYNKHHLKHEDFTKDAVLYFGIGWEEMHREAPIRKNWEPFEVCMPLIDEVIENNEVLARYKIKQPRLYDYGFQHNNCFARCVKAGQGHFKKLQEVFPDVFQKTLEQEHYLNVYVSSYHYIKKHDELSDDEKEVMLNELDHAFKPYFYDEAEKPSMYVTPGLHFTRYAFMKKSKDNVTEPYKLRDLKQDTKREGYQCDIFDVGGCGCFVNYE